MPLGATIEEIHELFTKFGEIQNLKLKKNKVYQTANITFVTPIGANLAI